MDIKFLNKYSRLIFRFHGENGLGLDQYEVKKIKHIPAFINCTLFGSELCQILKKLVHV